MNNVEIYDGVTEKKLLETVNKVNFSYNDCLKDCKKKKILFACGVAITSLNLVALVNMIQKKSPLMLIHLGYTILCGVTLNKNYKDLKIVKEKKKILKRRLDFIEEKLPVETDCIVR